MSDTQKYGKFLSRLNQSGKMGRILKVERKLLKTDIIPLRKDGVVKPASKSDMTLLDSAMSAIKSIVSNSSEKEQFNNIITEAINNGYSLISKKTKTSEYSYDIRGTIIDTILNNEYSGIITPNGEIVEIVKKYNRPIKDNLEPPKEIFNITPKLGKHERESYNHMIDFVISKKEYFFSKKSGIGYSYGYSKNLLYELSNCDYFAIITVKRHLIEFVKKDSRKIQTNMSLPYFMRAKD